MANLAGFNANEVPESSFEVLPPGVYTVMATQEEEKENSQKRGSYLMFVLDVLTEVYSGKKLWVYLNLWHENEAARPPAQRELAALCLAVGVPTPKQSSELLGKPFLVAVDIEKDKQGKDRNRITGYYPVGAVPAAAAPAPAAKSAPWSK
jgi:hypothetical protein